MHDIPTISLTPWFESGHRATPELSRRIDEACVNTGFLLVSGHGLDQRLLNEAFHRASDFFDQPQSAKDRWHPAEAGSQRGYHGYETRGLASTLGTQAPPDMRESLFFGPVDDHRHRFRDADAKGAYAPNLYPTRLAPVLVPLYRQFESLTTILLHLMAHALGAPEDYFDDRITRHFSVLACHFYPPPPAAPRPGQQRTGEHTDFGAFTILAMTGGDGGLEVRMPDGQWRGIRTGSGELVVNIGDMMARWTNNRWLSTLHRVANPTGDDPARTRRQSIGYFMHPDYDAVIECIPSVLGRGNRPKYPSITAGEHIRTKIARSHGQR